MLLYKAWRESQSRFLLSALAIAGLCACFVWYHAEARASIDQYLSYDAYIWRIVYKGYLRELFVILILLLGFGGLLRERAYGTAGFTLAFPVSRWRLVASRAAVGLTEVAALSFLPALVIPAASQLVHQSYPLSQALQFALLWTVCGTFFFTLAFLPSVIFGGEYVAPVASILGLLVYSLFSDLPGVERHLADIHDVMGGEDMPYFSESLARITGPLPWTTLGIFLLFAVGMMALATRITERQDF